MAAKRIWFAALKQSWIPATREWVRDDGGYLPPNEAKFGDDPLPKPPVPLDGHQTFAMAGGTLVVGGSCIYELPVGARKWTIYEMPGAALAAAADVAENLVYIQGMNGRVRVYDAATSGLVEIRPPSGSDFGAAAAQILIV